MTTSSFENLSHSRWGCKYHVVFVPKCRKKSLYGKIRKYLRPVFHEFAGQRNSKIIEGHVVQDHVHMMISIPPKYAVAEVIGYKRGRVPSQVLDNSEGERETLMEKNYGFEDTQFQQ